MTFGKLAVSRTNLTTSRISAVERRSISSSSTTIGLPRAARAFSSLRLRPPTPSFRRWSTFASTFVASRPRSIQGPISGSHTIPEKVSP
jgi:hypothetical protein